MAAVTFDTYKFVRKLKESGFNEQQAEALTDAVQAAQTSADIATKADLHEYESALRNDLEKLDLRLVSMEERTDAKLEKLELRLSGEMKLLRWGMGVIIAGVASLVLKTFF